jgi:DNA repair exonuclease SbcCD ATPase subunit
VGVWWSSVIFKLADMCVECSKACLFTHIRHWLDGGYSEDVLLRKGPIMDREQSGDVTPPEDSAEASKQRILRHAYQLIRAWEGAKLMHKPAEQPVGMTEGGSTGGRRRTWRVVAAVAAAVLVLVSLNVLAQGVMALERDNELKRELKTLRERSDSLEQRLEKDRRDWEAYRKVIEGHAPPPPSEDKSQELESRLQEQAEQVAVEIRKLQDQIKDLQAQVRHYSTEAKKHDEQIKELQKQLSELGKRGRSQP